MAYTKTIWEAGDYVTPTKLNNIETGIKDNEDAISSLDAKVDALIELCNTLAAEHGIDTSAD